MRLGEAGPFEIGGASLCQLFGRRPAISVGSNRYPTGLAAYVREPTGALRWRRNSPRNAGSSQQLRMAYYRGENRHGATDDLVCAHCDVFACAYRRQKKPAPGPSAERTSTRRTPARQPIIQRARIWRPISRLPTTPETTKRPDLRVRMGFEVRRDPYVDRPNDTLARRPARYVTWSPSAIWAR